jgi:hypothetical protein
MLFLNWLFIVHQALLWIWINQGRKGKCLRSPLIVRAGFIETLFMLVDNFLGFQGKGVLIFRVSK